MVSTRSSKASGSEEGLGTSPESLGWWVEGSWVDRFDKKLSMFVFTLSMPDLLESLLTMPGCWLGLPVSSWGIAPFYCVWYAEHVLVDLARVVTENDVLKFVPKVIPLFEHWPDFARASFAKFLLAFGVHTQESMEYLIYVCVGPTIMWALLWFYWLKVEQPYKAYALSTKYLTGPLLVLGIKISQELVPEGYRVAMFYVVGWLASQTVVHLIKITAARQRPIVLIEELGNVHRTHRSLVRMLSQGRTCIQSFPSGDACGAGTLTATLALLGCPWKFAIIWVVLTSFGRMYFHAHHLLDVSVGGSIGVGITYFLGHTFGTNSFGGYELLGYVIAFAVYYVGSERFSPVLPKRFVIAGREAF